VGTFAHVTQPSSSEGGRYAPALRFDDSRVMAVLAALVGFCHVVDGFTNGQLVQRVAALLDAPYTTRQALRRLKRKGLIRRLESGEPWPCSSQRATLASCPTAWRSLTHDFAMTSDAAVR
jgi:hypothetical protein